MIGKSNFQSLSDCVKKTLNSMISGRPIKKYNVQFIAFEMVETCLR